MTPFALGLLLAAAGALAVGFLGQGTRAAAAVGWLLAAALVAGFGPGVIAPLALFVLGAGGLTRVGRDLKERLGASEPNRGRRGVANVLAKIGVPAALGAAATLAPEIRGPAAIAATAALAGAFADTVATEVGPLAGGKVVRVEGWRLRRAAHGATGGVSAAGLAAAAGAAALLALTARAAGVLAGNAAVATAAGSGFAATLVESAIAGGPAGARLGHFGRNVLVSGGAAALAWLAAGAWNGGIGEGIR